MQDNNITASTTSIITEVEIINNQNELYVSSLEVARNFNKEHKDVLEKIDNYRAENSAVLSMFKEDTYTASNGKRNKCYLINRDGFSLLCMGFTGAKALDWKIKYINAFNKMEGQLKQASTLSEKEALQLAILNGSDMEKINAVLEYESIITTPLLEDIDKMQEQINKMEPKSNYYDTLVCTDNLTTIRDTAKLLGIRERDFVGWLLEHKYIYRNKNKNRTLKPYARYCGENKLFTLKENQNHLQAYITINGRQLFQEKLSNNKNGDK